MSANNLRPIDLEVSQLLPLAFADFKDQLLAKLAAAKTAGFEFYDGQRARRARWVNGSRQVLAVLAAIATLFAAVAAVLRILYPDCTYDKWLLAIALLLYAIIGAVSFYEKVTDNATAYFRHLGVTLAIRDLWTKLQFEVLHTLSQVPAGDAAAEKAAKERLILLAGAFCADINRLSTTELAEWRSEFLTSLSELEAAAKKGTEETQKQLQETVKALEQMVAAAARKADEAARPAYVNLTLEGDFDGQATILVDDVAVATTHLKAFPLDRINVGMRKFEVRAKKGSADRQAASLHEIKGGIQNVALKLV